MDWDAKSGSHFYLGAEISKYNNYMSCFKSQQTTRRGWPRTSSLLASRSQDSQAPVSKLEFESSLGSQPIG